jgi:RNA polymerase sigma-70 factor (ECF subfamily)
LPKDYQHISDEELLSRFRNDGNNDWLGIVLERYTMLLFGVCMKYLKHEEQARDAVQQVFLKALSEVPKYKIDNIGGWLYQVARNLCLSKLRSKKEYSDEESLQYIAQPEEVPLSLLIEKEKDIDRLKKELQTLKEEQKVCIAAFYLEKKSYNQISELTGFSVKQVKSHIQNGKRNLRLKLESS